MPSKERLLDQLAAWARPGSPELREALGSGAAADRLGQWLDADQDPDLFPEYRQDAPVAAFLADAVLARVFSDASPCDRGYAAGAGAAFVDLLSIAYVQNTVLLPPSERRGEFQSRLSQLRAVRDARRERDEARASEKEAAAEEENMTRGGAMFGAAPSLAAGCGPAELSKKSSLDFPAPCASAPAGEAFRSSVPPPPARPRTRNVFRWAGFGAVAFAGMAFVTATTFMLASPSYEESPAQGGDINGVIDGKDRPSGAVPPPVATGTPASSGAVSGTGAQEGWMDASRAALRKMWQHNQAEMAVAAGGAFVLFFSNVLKEAVNALVAGLKGAAAATLGAAGRGSASAFSGLARALARRRHRRSDGVLFWLAWHVLRPLGAEPLRAEISAALLQVADTLKRDADFVALTARRDREAGEVRDEARGKLRQLAGG